MAKLPRKTQKILGSNSSQNGQFGSRRSGSGLLTNDVEVIQALPAWENGWPDAAVSGLKVPTLEEMQGVQYVETSQLAYLFQEGIPEYDDGTKYFINSIVKKSGTTELYKSIVDDNLNNALTDNTKWAFMIDIAAIKSHTAPVTTTSGTTKDFAIPSWVNKITLNLSGVSIDASGVLSLLLGTASSFETTGYSGNGSSISSTVTTDSQNNAFIVHRSLAAADIISGRVILTRIVSTNTWLMDCIVNSSAGNNGLSSGAKTLSAALTRIRLTTIAGTASFDAGSANLIMEG